MSLADILAAKQAISTPPIEQQPRREIPVGSAHKNALLLFFILFYVGDKEKELYIDYLAGAKVLIAWLRPFSPSTMKAESIPTLIHNYTLQEIAVIMEIPVNSIWKSALEAMTLCEKIKLDKNRETC